LHTDLLKTEPNPLSLAELEPEHNFSVMLNMFKTFKRFKLFNPSGARY